MRKASTLLLFDKVLYAFKQVDHLKIMLKNKLVHFVMFINLYGKVFNFMCESFEIFS